MHKLLTKKQTAERVGLSVSTIERLMDKKLFPQPVNPNGTERIAFVECEVQGYIEEQMLNHRGRSKFRGRD